MLCFLVLSASFWITFIWCTFLLLIRQDEQEIYSLATAYLDQCYMFMRMPVIFSFLNNVWQTISPFSVRLFSWYGFYKGVSLLLSLFCSLINTRNGTNHSQLVHGVDGYFHWFTSVKYHHHHHCHLLSKCYSAREPQ